MFKKYLVTVEDYKDPTEKELKYYETTPKIFIAFLVLISAILPIGKIDIGLE
uniref:hypothetical protein n=1 Tax=Flavobacterium sp. TaxID=239 RepID=UPI00404B97EE